MRTTRLGLLGFGLLLACAFVTPAKAQVDPIYAPGGFGPSTVNFDVFYNELSPYGSWVQCEPYGWIWMPAGVAAGWQPYSTGYWGYTSAWGYTWYADEVWGWAPFHYGNWIYTPAYGWAWIPGYTWGPAWVSWRYGAGYVAWAPLAPRYYGGYGYGGYGYYGGGNGGRRAPTQPDVRNGVQDTVDPKHYVVVPEESFGDNKPVATAMRRDIGEANFNRMQRVDKLPQLRTAAGATPSSRIDGDRTVTSRIDDSPGARDIARIDRTNVGPTPHSQQLDTTRVRDISQPSAIDRSRDLGQSSTTLDTGRVRELGRDGETRTALPRLSPTPRLPAVGSNDRVYTSGNRPSYPAPIGGQSMPSSGSRVMPSTPASQPRVMPSSPTSQPRSMPSQPTFQPRQSMPTRPSYNAAPRIAPMPRSAPVMRSAPASRPVMRSMPAVRGARPR